MTEPEVYSGPERRRLETIQMEAIEAVVERLMAKLIAQHEVNERAMWDEWMTRAFPEGDPESHRTYHQSKIDAATAEKEFYQTLKIKLAEAGALDSLAGHRNAARWEVAGIEQRRPLLPGSPEEARVELPAPQTSRTKAANLLPTRQTRSPVCLVRSKRNSAVNIGLIFRKIAVT